MHDEPARELVERDRVRARPGPRARGRGVGRGRAPATAPGHDAAEPRAGERQRERSRAGRTECAPPRGVAQGETDCEGAQRNEQHAQPLARRPLEDRAHRKPVRVERPPAHVREPRAGDEPDDPRRTVGAREARHAQPEGRPEQTRLQDARRLEPAGQVRLRGRDRRGGRAPQSLPARAARAAVSARSRPGRLAPGRAGLANERGPGVSTGPGAATLSRRTRRG